MILIGCNSHELRFSENERTQVILVHFMKICSGAPFLWFVEYHVESRLVLMHRVEDNLQDKRQPIILAEQCGEPIKTGSKQVPDKRGKRCNCVKRGKTQ